jgi:hypothetical protein
MSGHVHAVLEQAKRLTADERIELARELLASVDEDEEAGTQEEIEAAWDDEIRRRDEQVLAGGGWRARRRRRARRSRAHHPREAMIKPVRLVDEARDELLAESAKYGLGFTRAVRAAFRLIASTR